MSKSSCSNRIVFAGFKCCRITLVLQASSHIDDLLPVLQRSAAPPSHAKHKAHAKFSNSVLAGFQPVRSYSIAHWEEEHDIINTATGAVGAHVPTGHPAGHGCTHRNSRGWFLISSSKLK